MYSFKLRSCNDLNQQTYQGTDTRIEVLEDVKLSDAINETAFLKLEKYLNEFTAKIQEEVKSIMVKIDSLSGLVDRLDRMESNLKHDTVTINTRLLDLVENKDQFTKQVKALEDENKNFQTPVKD